MWDWFKTLDDYTHYLRDYIRFFCLFFLENTALFRDYYNSGNINLTKSQKPDLKSVSVIFSGSSLKIGHCG